MKGQNSRIMLDDKPPAFRIVVVATLLAAAAATLGLFVSGNVLAPLVVAGGMCAVVIGWFMLGRPLLALWVAIFLRIMHIGDPERRYPPCGLRARMPRSFWL